MLRRAVTCLLLLSIACEDEPTTGGAGGGGNPSTGGAGGVDPTSNGGSGATGAAGGAGGAGATGGTGGAECPLITSLDFAPFGPTQFSGAVTPALGGSDEDFVALFLLEDSTGTIPLGIPATLGECTATAVCGYLVEDLTPTDVGRAFFAESGTVNLGSSSPPYFISGSLEDVRYVEATLDEETGVITVVPGGDCFRIDSLAFDFPPPTPGWTCDAAYFQDGQYCDCDCGASDADCDDGSLQILGCAPGQTCNAGTCAGIPSGWSCGAGTYDAGNQCHCGCGLYDPDCDTSPTVVGCAGGASCNGGGVCVPAAWTCNEEFYGDQAGCDCAEAPGCGVQDVDCNDPMQTVFGCTEATDLCVNGLCTPLP